MSEVVPDFRFDPDAGAYLASFGPKGSGKSELNKRLFVSYPYDGLLVDHTGDADPGYRWTEPLPPALEAIAARVVVEKGGEIPNQPGLEAEIAAAWQGEKPGPHKYRHEPNYLADDWLERSDRVIGLAYLHGRCDIFLDEIDDAAPTNQTPRFTRLTLRMGRHRAISLGMAGPRPIGVDPLVLSQPDVVTIHGPLHERDLARLAAQFHMSRRPSSAASSRSSSPSATWPFSKRNGRSRSGRRCRRPSAARCRCRPSPKARPRPPRRTPPVRRGGLSRGVPGWAQRAAVASTRRRGSWALKTVAIALAVVVGVELAKKKLASRGKS